MNRRCPPEDALSALVDEALPAGEREPLLAHSARCPLCAARLAELRALHDAFRALPTAAPGFDFGASVIARLQAERVVPPAPSRSPWSARLAALIAAMAGWRNQLVPLTGTTAAIGLGVWLGGMLLAAEEAVSPPSTSATLVAMRLFDAVPPGNLCPRVDACGANGSTR